MKRLGLLFGAAATVGALLATTPVSPATAAFPTPAGCVSVSANVLECSVPVPAETGSLGSVDTRVRVVVPGDTDGPLPVVYLLHGVGDTFSTIVERTDIEGFGGDLGALIVMPDGGRNLEAGWYSDWADGSRRYETFHTDVLVDWVDANFPTYGDRAHRGVAGISMGGLGAVSYAGRHPDLFGAAGSFSGFLDTQFGGPVTGYGMGIASPYTNTPDSRVWGDPATSAGDWSAHNPSSLAADGALDHLAGNLWLSHGTGTPGGPAGEPDSPLPYGRESYIFHTNLQFKIAAARASLPYHDESWIGGAHDWPYYELGMRRILPHLVAAIS